MRCEALDFWMLKAPNRQSRVTDLVFGRENRHLVAPLKSLTGDTFCAIAVNTGDSQTDQLVKLIGACQEQSASYSGLVRKHYLHHGTPNP